MGYMSISLYSRCFPLPSMMVLIVLLLAGCATDSAMVKQQEPTSPDSVASEDRVSSTESSADQSIDAETLLVFLTGEIAAQRGKLDFAYSNYMQAALQTEDVYAARRATRIALFLKDNDKAYRAARLWVARDAGSVQAHNTLAIMALRKGHEQEALAQLEKLFELSENGSTNAFMLVALSLTKEKKAQEALALMSGFVEKHPKDARAYNGLAILQVAQKQLDAAILSLQKALELEPEDVGAKTLTVRILVEQGKNSEAVSYIEQALQDHPDNFEMKLLHAKLLVQIDHERSYSAFKKLHKESPENAEIVSALGVLAAQLEDMVATRQWWGLLLEIGDREQRSVAAFQLGQLQELAGNIEDAAAYYDQVNHGEYRIDARIRLARIRAEKGDISDARDIFKQLRVLNPAHGVEYYLAEAQMLHDRVSKDEVLAFYEQALQALPDNIELLYSRGLYASDRDLLGLAEADFRKILEIKPEHADTLNALGYTLADQTDRYNEAMVYISKAYKLKPESAAILDSMGWVNYRLGNFELAVTYLRKALAEVNDDEIAAHLGEVLWVTGETGQAREVWKRALQDFPDSSILTEVMKRLDH